MQVSCTLHFKGNKRYRLIFWKKELSNKAWLKYRDGPWTWKVKDKELTQLYCFDWNKFNVSDSSTLFFFRLVTRLKHRNDLKGNKNYFEIAAASSYRGFELSRVNYSKWMKENQGKSTLVRVSEACSRLSDSGVRSLRNRRLEVVGERENWRPRFFLCPLLPST